MGLTTSSCKKNVVQKPNNQQKERKKKKEKEKRKGCQGGQGSPTAVTPNEEDFCNISHGSTIGIATGYRQDNRGAGVPVSVGSRILTSSYHQNSSGVHPASYPVGTRGTFPGGKAARS
jgi:hypothetical protein